ncbi:uncharacterized protein LOC122518920 isoform X4 [Polistes fuscatus]|uniref:uncharacterized protein LOC122518920 isoform X4 n=1 Tax=Polistes fuscatus TaxID=30207 RepID=UPI001CA9A0FF|nr:uncharacterized protein LOC122518920 isoform X4 [Polistes fuscatus]
MDFLWLNGFLNRHPELSKRIAQNLTACRASISEFSIKKWFSEVEIELKQKSLLNIESNRVFNGDESAFMLAPKSDKVFVKKAGDLAPPLVVFSYKRVPNNIRENMPHDWAAGKSDNGWMNGENFFEYIANIFYPWLIDNKIKFPVVLYIDGHSSHLTMTVTNAINYTKLRNKSTEATNIDEIEAPKDDNRRLLSLFESLMDPNTLKKFTEVGIDGAWNGDLEDSSLFSMWKSMQSSVAK